MKRELQIVMLGAMLSMPLVAAQAGEPYVGANIGRANHKVYVEVGDETAKSTATSYKVYGGYNFSKYIGVEGGYIDLGSSKTTFSDGFYLKGSGNSFYAALTGTLPLSEKFSLFSKIGLATSHSKWNNSFGDKFNESQTSTIFGIGAMYDISANLSVVAEYENLGKAVKIDDDYLKVDMLSIGLRYKF